MTLKNRFLPLLALIVWTVGAHAQDRLSCSNATLHGSYGFQCYQALYSCFDSQLFVDWHQPARQAVRALVRAPTYERGPGYKIEALFAELKQRM